MGYKTVQDAVAAVLEVVFEAASHEYSRERIEQLVEKHPWAREHLSPEFHPAKDLHEIASMNPVSLDILANEKAERLPPENVYIGVKSGERQYGFRFAKNEAGEYVYHGFKTSYEF